MTKPSIILIRPQMGENIGATARAMHNFGLSDLRIVNPRDGWPNEKALSMAANAKGIIEGASLYNSVAEAIEDCHQVIATTARHRGMNKPEMPMQSMAVGAPNEQKVAIMFGPERTGLENEDITHADAVLHIPVSPDNPSLNLGQAVNIVCYEWFVQGVERALSRGLTAGSLNEEGERVRDPAVKPRDDKHANLGGYMAASKDRTPATHGDLQALFDHLEGYLDEANFWNVPEKKPKMWQNIRNSLTRAQLTKQEVQTWHGVFRAVAKRK